MTFLLMSLCVDGSYFFEAGDAFPQLPLSVFLKGWLLVVAKKHTGLVYNSRENSFPDRRWIHSVGIVHLGFMVSSPIQASEKFEL
jgi:hypothetical protein